MELPDRDQHDRAAAGAIAILFSRHRRELQELLGNPPDWSRVTPAFWARVQRETEEELAAILLLVYIISGTFHGAPESEVTQQARGWSAAESQRSARQMTETTVSRVQVLAEEWRIREAAGERISQRETTRGLVDVFSPERAGRVAMDQVTTAQTAAGEWSARNVFGLSEDDEWINHPEQSKTGPCPICKPLHRTKRTYWERLLPGGPPAHPMCVCTVQYVNIDAMARN